MEYVTPPQAASILLNLFASEADFAIVLGDLTEEFQKRVCALGHASARRWYWREVFRNVFAWIKREFLRTPVQALAVGLATSLGVSVVVALLTGPVRLDVQWAWIPPRYWHLFQYTWLILVPFLLYIGTGAIAGMLVRGRELAVALSFATWSTVYCAVALYILTYSAARGRLPRTFNLSQLNERLVIQWAGIVLLYFFGCIWIRWHRISRLSSRAS